MEELSELFEKLSEEEKDMAFKAYYQKQWVNASRFRRDDNFIIVVSEINKGITLSVPDSAREDLLTLLMNAYKKEIQTIEQKTEIL